MDDWRLITDGVGGSLKGELSIGLIGDVTSANGFWLEPADVGRAAPLGRYGGGAVAFDTDRPRGEGVFAVRAPATAPPPPARASRYGGATSDSTLCSLGAAVWLLRV